MEDELYPVKKWTWLGILFISCACVPFQCYWIKYLGVEQQQQVLLIDLLVSSSWFISGSRLQSQVSTKASIICTYRFSMNLAWAPSWLDTLHTHLNEIIWLYYLLLRGPSLGITHNAAMMQFKAHYSHCSKNLTNMNPKSMLVMSKDYFCFLLTILSRQWACLLCKV
jgi:hypothetical protein